MAHAGSKQDYRLFLTMLREMREAAGITQVALAARLRNSQSFVSKCERGERRLDFVEWLVFCEAIGAGSGAFLKRFLDRRDAPHGLAPATAGSASRRRKGRQADPLSYRKTLHNRNVKGKRKKRTVMRPYRR